jgi:CubicO group peptidase (beta-lactamase class C family)
LSLVFVCGTCSIAEDAPSSLRAASPVFDSQSLKDIDQTMQSFVDQGKLAGVLTLIARCGQVIQVGTYGQADLEADKPMRRDSLFRIYSMTKPITTAALLILYQEGKFELDDPVARYLPQFADVQVYSGTQGGQVQTVPASRSMTIRDLMRHTAGLAYGLFPASPVDAMYMKEKLLDRDRRLDQMIDKLVTLPLAAHPGEKWIYSISVDVQGRLIEVLSGQALDEFFRTRIFQPLGMSDTFFTVPEDKLSRLTANYGLKDGKLTAIDAPNRSEFAKPAAFFSGGGGLVSTADDYLRFAQMLLGGGELDGVRILQPEIVELMTRNHLTESLVPIRVGLNKMEGMGFGLGVAVRVKVNDDEPESTLGEYGWAGAASTQFWVTPDQQLICIAMTQLMPAKFDYALALRQQVLNAMAEPVGN